MKKLFTSDQTYIKIWEQARGRLDWEQVAALEAMDRICHNAIDSARKFRELWESTECYEREAMLHRQAARNEPPVSRRAPAESDG